VQDLAFSTKRPRKLRELIHASELLMLRGSLEMPVTGIAYHSRQVERGFLFVAIPGQKDDGHRYIQEAISRGASAIICEHENIPEFEGTVVKTADARATLARIAARFYDHPSRDMTVIGITGTNGKTTTSFLLESILEAAGFNVGVIGTINYRFGNQAFTAATTTPQSLDLQALLSRMREAGVSHVVMEVSSHALEQKRVDEVNYRGAVFTNLSHDHLDYHRDMESYFRAKSRLFSLVNGHTHTGSPLLLVNGDDAYGARLIEQYKTSVSYGLRDGVTLKATCVQATFGGLKASITDGRHILAVASPLLGTVNIYNILAAVGVSLWLGVSPSVIEKGVAHLSSVPGRLFPVQGPEGITALIDYAHTPDALERTLESVRNLCSRRVITVFGCGGDRDPSKRPLMGRVVGMKSDMAVVTSDNPRSEDPMEIIEDIEPGLLLAGMNKVEPSDVIESRSYLVIPDRREAIRAAVRAACPGDLILIAGKGHENYQIIGKTIRDFDDVVEARKAFQEIKGQNGSTLSKN
jgi:UDP-N-acetylmuramoyl-L-alanyl-D-glutamate--2,6-diaminopimelate ligase